MPRTKLKVLCVFGTRPEAIKMAPVLQQLLIHPEIVSCTCVTGQHRHMLDQVLNLFGIQPDHDLNIMRPDQSLSFVTGQILMEIEKIIQAELPDWVLVQGDTTTAMAAALAAFYQGVPIGHIEAGLRTYNRRQPFPEEINRRIVDNLADWLFAPTVHAQQNLIQEGVAQAQILVTGNTIVDALQHILTIPGNADHLELSLPQSAFLILVTAHRRENFGDPLEQICQAINLIAATYGSAVHLLYPVHSNPNVREPVFRLLGNRDGITLTEPLDYLTFVRMMRKASLILTDSGGIQEEATVLGKPVLVMRDTTERTEALTAGNSQLVGTQPDIIVQAVDRLLNEPEAYKRMSRPNQIYGDGRASERIVRALLNSYAS